MKKGRVTSLICAALVGASMLAVLPAAEAYDSNAGVVINEVCTGNNGKNGNLTDVVDTKGEYCDWVELYNPSESDADLTGLYITDDENDLTQAQIPDGTVIPSKGYLIIYCGKNIDTAAYPNIVAAKFGLSASGETLILSDGTNEYSRVTVPEMKKDLTYAAVPSGSDAFALCYPTPNADNTEDMMLKEPDAPVFSRDSGAFKDSFELTITAPEGAKIYYTTDGSDPTSESTKYTDPITVVDRTSEPNVLAAMDKSLFSDRYGSGAPTVKVDKATVIKAIAVKDGLASAVITKSYFVGITNETYSNVAIMSIVTDSDNLFDPDTGIYMLKNVNNKGKEWERPVHIDFIENDTAVLSQDCGMRIQGGYSRSDYQKSLRFYARKDYGADKFDYPLLGELYSRDGEGRVVDSFEKFVLRNGGNDANYVKFKDSMLQKLVSEMDISTQAGRPCVAFINGEYWGLYTMQEDYTDDYVKSHYDVKKKNVVIVKPDSLNNNKPKVDEGEDEDIELWNNAVNWVKTADLSDNEQYEYFKTLFDVKNLADYFAVETYITNEDWSGKNWCVWRSRDADENNSDYADQKWRFMLYDTEMGAYLWGNNGESPQNNKLMQIYDSGKSQWEPVSMLVYKALQNPDFKDLFKESMRETAQKYDKEIVKSALASYKASYYPNLKKYFDRFPTGSAMWSADQCIGWMEDFFYGKGSLPARQDYYEMMLRTLDLTQLYNSLDRSSIDATKLSEIDSTYKKMYNGAKRTSTSYSSQIKYAKNLEYALADAGVLDFYTLPDNFAADVSGNTITLNWDSVPDADGYIINMYRSGESEPIATYDLGADDTSKIITDVEIGKYDFGITTFKNYSNANNETITVGGKEFMPLIGIVVDEQEITTEPTTDPDPTTDPEPTTTDEPTTVDEPTTTGDIEPTTASPSSETTTAGTTAAESTTSKSGNTTAAASTTASGNSGTGSSSTTSSIPDKPINTGAGTSAGLAVFMAAAAIGAVALKRRKK